MPNLDSINHRNPTQPPKIAISSVPNRPQQASLIRSGQKPPGKKILKKILWSIVCLIVILGGVVLVRAANLSQKIFVGQKTTFFGRSLT